MKSSLVAPAIPEPVWAPALTLLTVGLLALGGWALGRPLLLPSLGPTIFMIALQPASLRWNLSSRRCWRSSSRGSASAW